MQEKQATGIDTQAMLPILGCVYFVICQLFFPWISIPYLKYLKLDTYYPLSRFFDAFLQINDSLSMKGKLEMEPWTQTELQIWCNIHKAFFIIALLLSVLVAVTGIMMYRKKIKALRLAKITLICTCLLPGIMFFVVGLLNMWINTKAGRENTFINLSLHSYVQMTCWPYAQMILSALLFVTVHRLLDTKKEFQVEVFVERREQMDKKIGKRTKLAILLILIGIPSCIFFGVFFLNDRSPSFVALCIIGLSMLPFGMIFEDRKPQAREILLIAVMAAIAAASRVAFFMVPQFKPLLAIVIITGVSLGGEAGFLTGAIAGFASNFFFGQGPWTPWQMFGFGIIGFLAGIIFHKKKQSMEITKKEKRKRKLWICIYGGFAALVIYGGLMDTASVTMFSAEFTWEVFAASYVTGFPYNMVHGFATVVFLAILTQPFERKLERIKEKYGMMEV